MHSRHPEGARQAGVALFISLVLLLVLTIAGVSAVQTTSLEERMARNARDRMLAFQAAESAMRDAERFIETMSSPDEAIAAPDFGGNEPWTDPVVWGGVPSRAGETALNGLAAAPRYIVEHVATIIREEDAFQLNDPYGASAATHIEIFRITTRGVGGSATARVMLQSTYGRIIN
jgi:type IV pilus assembly protein PilX